MLNLYISHAAIRQIKNELRLFPNEETGGVILGWRFPHFWIAILSTTSGKQSRHEKSRFIMGEEEISNEVAFCRKQFRFPLSVIGYWHKHNHEGCRFSGEDQRTNSQFAKLSPCGAVSILAAVSEPGKAKLYAFHIARSGVTRKCRVSLLAF